MKPLEKIFFLLTADTSLLQPEQPVVKYLRVGAS